MFGLKPRPKRYTLADAQEAERKMRQLARNAEAAYRDGLDAEYDAIEKFEAKLVSAIDDAVQWVVDTDAPLPLNDAVLLSDEEGAPLTNSMEYSVFFGVSNTAFIIYRDKLTKAVGIAVCDVAAQSVKRMTSDEFRHLIISPRVRSSNLYVEASNLMIRSTMTLLFGTMVTDLLSIRRTQR